MQEVGVVAESKRRAGVPPQKGKTWINNLAD